MSEFFHIWKDMRVSAVGLLTFNPTCWWWCINQHTRLFIACACRITSLVTVRPCPIVVELSLYWPKTLISLAMVRIWCYILIFVRKNFLSLFFFQPPLFTTLYTRIGTLIVATIYLQLIQNRYMFRSLNVLQCSHQHCVQPVASDVEVVGYL